MEIVSQQQIIPIKPQDGLLGFTNFVIDNKYFVGGIGIYSRPKGGVRLTFPHKVLPNGKVINIFHPITKESGLFLEQATEKALERIIDRP